MLLLLGFLRVELARGGKGRIGDIALLGLAGDLVLLLFIYWE